VTELVRILLKIVQDDALDIASDGLVYSSGHTTDNRVRSGP
jgi:hypothetical protein